MKLTQKYMELFEKAPQMSDKHSYKMAADKIRSKIDANRGVINKYEDDMRKLAASKEGKSDEQKSDIEAKIAAKREKRDALERKDDKMRAEIKALAVKYGVSEESEDSKRIQALIDTNFSASDEEKGKAAEMLKGLFFSDSPEAKEFIQKLDKMLSDMKMNEDTKE